MADDLTPWDYGIRLGDSKGAKTTLDPASHHDLAELRAIVVALAEIVAEGEWGGPRHARAFELVARARGIGGG